MIPAEINQAIEWALQQTYDDGIGNQIAVTKENPQALVDHVRRYFNEHNIQYSTFSYDDLIPFLN